MFQTRRYSIAIQFMTGATTFSVDRSHKENIVKRALIALSFSLLFSVPSFGGSLWSIDHAGVCRDNSGQYPRWNEYDEWTLEKCEMTCGQNQNCQGFAMAKNKNYCQLFGSDGSRPASKEGTIITRGDSRQSGYTCFIKVSR